MKYEPKLEKEMLCPLEYGLATFGGKWRSRIICVLSGRSAMRYSEVRKELSNITDAVLAATLKELIADDMIARLQYNEIPPRVEYALTETVKSSLPILQSICAWSRDHSKEDLDKKLPRCKTCPQLYRQV